MNDYRHRGWNKLGFKKSILIMLFPASNVVTSFLETIIFIKCN